MRDVRSNIRLWGMESEIACHAEMSKMPKLVGKRCPSYKYWERAEAGCMGCDRGSAMKMDG